MNDDEKKVGSDTRLAPLEREVRRGMKGSDMSITLEEYTERLRQVAELELLLSATSRKVGQQLGEINGLKEENLHLKGLLADARNHTYDYGYKWNMEFRAEVDRALSA